MKLLVLGGTGFLSGHLAGAALRRGHEVTLFHRGRTNPDLYPEAEHVLGDRSGDLSELQGREWDAVVDCSAYLLKQAETAAAVLAAAARYVFVSTISVYTDFEPGMDEDAPVATLPEGVDRYTDQVGHYYGALKALCEDELRRRFEPDRLAIVRPGLIVGPNDPTERFTYWVSRAADGGEILAPGDAAQPAQFIDARDLADWMLLLAAPGAPGGTFNATGPAGPLTLGEVIDAAVAVAGTGASSAITWVPDQFLLDHEVAPWMGLPLWLPAEETGLLRVSIERALAAGLTFRPLEQTIADTLEWVRATPDRRIPPIQLTRERERELLQPQQ